MPLFLRQLSVLACTVVTAMFCAAPISAQPGDAPLQLEGKIALGAARGRIDHMAIDLERHRLFVAELGNDSVGVVDLESRKVVHRLAGMKEPQGIGYLPAGDTLVIANGGDGSARFFQGPDYAANGRIELGSDADNVRVDKAAKEIIVGYGGGALAVIDPDGRRRIADIRLPGHPESFQLDPSSKRIYVNVPRAHEIAVVDQATRRQVGAWPTGELSANFPLALDESHHRVLAVFRHPAMLGVFQAQDGRRIAIVPTCGDSDDLFVDAKRSLVYVICGEGYVDVVAARAESYASLGRIATLSGARTGLFIPEIDRLVVAARAKGSEPAAVWVLRPLL